MESNIERRLFKEQIRKELLDELNQFKVGLAYNGELFALKSSDKWAGFIFIIPEEKYRELFGHE